MRMNRTFTHYTEQPGEYLTLFCKINSALLDRFACAGSAQDNQPAQQPVLLKAQDAA